MSLPLELDMLRHGETERGGVLRGSLDDPLTDTGWQQMHDAVHAAGPWDLLVSSPLQRCALFAEALAERLGLPLEIHDDLRELHFGDWEGLGTAQLMETAGEALGRFWADPYGFTPPSGEPVLAFQARILKRMQHLQRLHAGKRVLMVGHGGVMRLLLAQARGLPREQLLQVLVANGARFALRVGADGQLSEPA